MARPPTGSIVEAAVAAVERHRLDQPAADPTVDDLVVPVLARLDRASRRVRLLATERIARSVIPRALAEGATTVTAVTAHVRTALDGLVPVLAEEVARVVAERHGVEPPAQATAAHDVLLALPGYDDPTVEASFLAVLITGEDMAPQHPETPYGAVAAQTKDTGTDDGLTAEQERAEREKAEREKEEALRAEREEQERAEREHHGEARRGSGTPRDLVAARGEWDDCPSPAVVPLEIDEEVTFDDDDVVDVVLAALQCDLLGRLYATAALEAAAQLESGELDLRLRVLGDEYETATALYCVVDEARGYGRKVDAFVPRILGRGPGSDRRIATRWITFLDPLENAILTPSEENKLDARRAADALRAQIAANVRLVDRMRINECLRTTARLRLAMRGFDREDAALALGPFVPQGAAYVADVFAEYAALAAILRWVRDGEGDEYKLVSYVARVKRRPATVRG